MFRLSALVLLCFFAVTPLVVDAQLIPTLESPLELVVIPLAPTPGEVVTVQVINVFSVRNPNFIWQVDGRTVDSGPNVRQISFTAPAVGVQTTITVRVEGGTTPQTATTTILPGEVDIVWEGKTERPPFYPGRPLSNRESTVVLSAEPTMREGDVRLSKNNLMYVWYVNDAPAPVARGRGLSSITLTPPRFGDVFTVRVDVTNPQGAARAIAQITIVPQEPEIIIYETEALLGVRFDRAQEGTFRITEEELTLRAWPLFTQKNINHQYTWRLNRDIVSTDEAPDTLTLRRVGEGSGRYGVSVTLENTRALFEKATKNITLEF